MIYQLLTDPFSLLLGVCPDVDFSKLNCSTLSSESEALLDFALVFCYSRCLGHGQREKLVKLLSFGQAILSSRKLYTAASSMIGLPGRFYQFLLCLNYLTQVHILYGDVQGSGKIRITYILRLIFNPFSMI